MRVQFRILTINFLIHVSQHTVPIKFHKYCPFPKLYEFFILVINLAIASFQPSKLDTDSSVEV
jgi:hypothetical protein